MANEISVSLHQAGSATSKADIREHSVLIDRPEAKGGNDRGPMGGELLLASLGGCFMSNLLAAIAARDADISEVHIAVAGTLDGNPPRYTAIRMQVSARCDDEALLRKLVTISERSCIVANTLKEAVALSIEIG